MSTQADFPAGTKVRIKADGGVGVVQECTLGRDFNTVCVLLHGDTGYRKHCSPSGLEAVPPEASPAKTRGEVVAELMVRPNRCHKYLIVLEGGDSVGGYVHLKSVSNDGLGNLLPVQITLDAFRKILARRIDSERELVRKEGGGEAGDLRLRLERQKACIVEMEKTLGKRRTQIHDLERRALLAEAKLAEAEDRFAREAASMTAAPAASSVHYWFTLPGWCLPNPCRATAAN